MTRGPVLAFGAVLLLGGVAAAELGGALPWNPDHDAGMALAAKTGKPAVVYFTADW